MTENIEDLMSSFERQKTPFQVRESLVRKYVAIHGRNEKAWNLLLRILSTNENWKEVYRLSRQMGKIFPSNIACRYATALSLANLQKIDDALTYIENLNYYIQSGEMFQALKGKLQLINNPKFSTGIFSKEKVSLSCQLDFSRGLVSAKSLVNSRLGVEIVFFQISPWHISIQCGIFDLLTSHSIGCVITNEFWLLEALKPKIIVLSDTPKSVINRIRWILKDSIIVNTRHGLGDKNYAYYASGSADYVCASSQNVARDQISSGCLDPDSFWVTGFPQMDNLFLNIEKSVYKNSGNAPRILFAPTFTPKMNSGELIGTNPVAMLRGNNASWHVTIRPHPNMLHTHPQIIRAWQESINKTCNATLDIDFNRSPAETLAASDILISDFSSIALQYLALDRPIICLVQDELATRSPFFDPHSYEFKLGQSAIKINNVNELLPSIIESLKGRQSKLIVNNRRMLAKYLFGDLQDGMASQRIAKNILTVLDKQHEKNLR